MKRVEGHPDIRRGPRGEIISVDQNGLLLAKAAKAKAEREIEILELLRVVVVELRELKEELRVAKQSRSV